MVALLSGAEVGRKREEEKKESLHPSFSSPGKTKGDKQSKQAASNKSEKRAGKRKMNANLSEFFSAREKNTEKEMSFQEVPLAKEVPAAGASPRAHMQKFGSKNCPS